MEGEKAIEAVANESNLGVSWYEEGGGKAVPLLSCAHHGGAARRVAQSSVQLAAGGRQVRGASGRGGEGREASDGRQGGEGRQMRAGSGRGGGGTEA